MDLHCRFCGEPIDNEELHDLGIPYKLAFKLFSEQGCGGIGYTCNPDTAAPEYVGVMTDLLGDDPDGLMAMLDDMAYLMGGE